MAVMQHRWRGLAALALAVSAFTSPALADPGLVVQCEMIQTYANDKIASRQPQSFYIDFEAQRFCFDACRSVFELRTNRRRLVDLSWQSGVSDGPAGEEIVIASANYHLEYDRASRKISGNGSGSGSSLWAVKVHGRCVEITYLPEPVRSFLKSAKPNPAPKVLPRVR